ncbi:hypothetical protein QYF61_016159 [Mycteria americana]|uniref:Rna-directed dna polymerase from mobile element jockey-like n=1 Tax=Mycteria americana TaxID=33587 RepID=A0AAN7S174_MYCAM|nr:hypothetical protein QYF61_016159 [Mycteria americana]
MCCLMLLRNRSEQPLKGHSNQGRFLRTRRKQMSLLSPRKAGRISQAWSAPPESLGRCWSKYSWKPFSNILSVHQKFNILVSDLDDGTACTLSKFVDNTKLGGMANTSDGCTATQKDVHRLQK